MKHIKMLIPALIALGLVFVAGGCMVHGTTGVYGHAYVEQPQLVYVSPGVQVVYDYHEPVFYSDGFYWRYYGGVWYRSSYHSHGWVRYHRVPHAVARIDRPQAYVRYRGNARGHGRVYRAPAGPEVRDHRGTPGYARPAPAYGHGRVDVRAKGGATVKPAAQPKVRDHRDHDKKDKGRRRAPH